MPLIPVSRTMFPLQFVLPGPGIRPVPSDPQQQNLGPLHRRHPHPELLVTARCPRWWQRLTDRIRLLQLPPRHLRGLLPSGI